jgi:hypothetical protein
MVKQKGFKTMTELLKCFALAVAWLAVLALVIVGGAALLVYNPLVLGIFWGILLVGFLTYAFYKCRN